MKRGYRGMCVVLGVCLAVWAGACSAQTGEARLGEEIATAFFHMQVEEVLAGADAPDEPNLPALGEDMEYLWVKLIVVAHDHLVLYYDDFDLEIDGTPIFPERAVSSKQFKEEQVMEQADTARGYLVYRVPQGKHKLRLVYTEFYEGDRQGDTHTVRLD